MANPKRTVLITAAVAAGIFACGTAGADLRSSRLAGPQNPPALITETLGALQAEVLSATATDTLPASDTPTFTPPPTDTPTDTPSPTPTETPSPTPTHTPIPTSSATAGPALLSVSAATNCYAGPSNKYGLVYTMRPGIMALVVGVDLLDSNWIISVPGYPGTVCWLSSQYALVTGDIANLPSPATPQPSIYTLSEPKNLRASCSSEPYGDEDASAWSVSLRWTNTEPYQTGVRIYRYGRVIATLRSRASYYNDYFIHYDFHSGVRYGVQAVSGSAVSSIVWLHMNSCH